MPVICVFDGAKVYVYYRDHAPPHIHVNVDEDWAVFTIRDGRLYEGELPARFAKKVRRWIAQRREALMVAWNAASAGREPQRVAPPVRKGRRS